jgi:hypothetical protein
MIAAEVRDRLDDRFKLLVGSRRGLERHQTLRQAVASSYDFLDEAEKVLLTSAPDRRRPGNHHLRPVQLRDGPIHQNVSVPRVFSL